jgi:hypothetical protein
MARGWGLKAGCFDGRLSPVWSKVVSFDLPPEPGAGVPEPSFAIRQEGPCHFVLNDDPARRPGPGRGKGLVLRWKDGRVEEFDDHTFATIDDGSCQRVTSHAESRASHF